MTQRAFQMRLDDSGSASIDVFVPPTNFEWEIYQISVNTSQFAPYCQVRILHNNFFLCSSPQGSIDTATGPPNTVVKPNDALTVQWVYGIPNDLATVSLFYNEWPVGGTPGTAH